ncbi:flagellar basal body L-ring protein FlgH [Rhizosaccharibacter radicis]|uniref:Flagellar L-ring protein n=1 Tax=Rhizosaccharibacter radicis TaxID=2782605 RepID=A0ABT1W2T8_9PROT|nr:flagellar basal body L-ring protein FlgH [Acetobacteraceae bacterium KSS12]
MIRYPARPIRRTRPDPVRRDIRRAFLGFLPLLLLSGCGALSRLSEIGRPPEMTPIADPTLARDYRPLTMPAPPLQPPPGDLASLWRPGSRAFFKDQRAAQAGDLITVVVAITDAATMDNNTTSNRTGTESMGAPALFGLKQRLVQAVTGANALSTSSTNGNNATGKIKRDETVTLRLAGTVTQVLPNGNFVVCARQEVRVNSELRILQVSGIVRPQDISSDNTIAHDRMAEARISYGGRGQLTDLQTPRYGQQLMDVLLPF